MLNEPEEPLNLVVSPNPALVAFMLPEDKESLPNCSTQSKLMLPELTAPSTLPSTSAIAYDPLEASTDTFPFTFEIRPPPEEEKHSTLPLTCSTSIFPEELDSLILSLARLRASILPELTFRSEERRVGKECRSCWS